MAKSWLRRAKVSDYEESADKLVGESASCFCVCRKIRALETIENALKRKAVARMEWRAAAEGHLNLCQGDIIDVCGKEDDTSGLDPDIIWYRGKIGEKEGIFPTTQLLYKVSGRPLLDSEGRHRFRTIVHLQPSDVFAKYSQGAVAAAAAVDRSGAATPTARPSTGATDAATEGERDGGLRDESLDSVMDCREFCVCLQELSLMAPAGHRPDPVQLSKDEAVRVFREANRADAADDDAANCTFDEFEDALGRVRAALGLGARADIERAGPGVRACSLGERQLGEALRLLNEAHRLIGGVDGAWQALLGHKARRLALSFAEFQEAHARQLTAGGRYDWAADKYAHARRLYGGDTGAAETAFPPDQARLAGLQRAFTVNQYRMAMQFLALSAPNRSSHRGIPLYAGDARDKAGQVARARAVFDGLGDHMAAATVWRADCELRLRRGEPDLALRAAVECMNEHSRTADGQGLAGAYRLLAEVQLVQGQVAQAVGSLQSSLQARAPLCAAATTVICRWAAAPPGPTPGRAAMRAFRAVCHAQSRSPVTATARSIRPVSPRRGPPAHPPHPVGAAHLLASVYALFLSFPYLCPFLRNQDEPRDLRRASRARSCSPIEQHLWSNTKPQGEPLGGRAGVSGPQRPGQRVQCALRSGRGVPLAGPAPPRRPAL